MYTEEDPAAPSASYPASPSADTVSVVELVVTEGPEAEPAALGFWTKAGTALALAGAAALSKYAEYKGIDHDMGAPERWVTDSAAHPIIGYVGAWAASRAAGKSAGNLKAGAGLAVVTAANFFTESMQSATVATGQYIEFWSSRNAPETLKDYAFALAGLGLFMWQERRGGYGEPEVSAD